MAATVKCQECDKTIVVSKIKMRDTVWHKKCIRCTVCDLQLSQKTARISKGKAYCIKHFKSSLSEAERNKAEETELPYFHDNITRSEAESRLKKSGDFLVRWSNSESAYIVSIKHQKDFTHARIPRMQNREFRFRNETLPTLNAWIGRHVLRKTPVVGKHIILSNPINRPGYTGPDADYDYPTLPPNTMSPNRTHKKGSPVHGEIRQIWMGSICKAEVDVIVNSTGLDTKLSGPSGGSLARAIAATGGPEIQSKLDSFRQKSAKPPTFGDVIVTPGFNLPSKFIFHVILKQWKDGRHVVLDLRRILKRVFRAADERKLTSIAIPPIGTGTLGYPKHIVAQVLYSEAADYLDSHPESNISKIIFVVNNKDDYSVLKEHQDTEDGEEIVSLEHEEADNFYDLLNSEFQKTKHPGYSTIQYPKNWRLTNTSEKPYELIELDDSSKEYADVVANVVTKSDGHKFENCIAKIRRVENGVAYQFYEHLKKVVIEANGEDLTNERVLWHGTTAEAVDNIVMCGFNRNYAGANATLYGKGVYFARDFSYSAQPLYSRPNPKTGLKHIFQCRVLIGKYCLGHKDLMEPDLLPDKKNRRYDSAVNSLQDPTIFVVFKDYVAYPEYLISFYDDSTDNRNNSSCIIL